MQWRISLVLLLLATACTGTTQQGDATLAATTPTAEVVAPTVPAPAGVGVVAERVIDPAEFQLIRAIGIAEQHGLFFFPATPDRPRQDLPSFCESSTSFLSVGASAIAGAVTVPGDQVYRVDFGPEDWGFAAVRCANDFSLVPLRIVDNIITVATDPATSMPVQLAGRANFFNLGSAVESSSWVSSTQIWLPNQQGIATDVLDLATGQVLSAPKLPLAIGFSTFERQLLETEATAPFVYYLPHIDQSCQLSSSDPVPAIQVVRDERATPVTIDLESMRSITQLVFGPSGQVAWLTNCYGVHTVWQASVNPETGHFDEVTSLADDQWSLSNGWVGEGGWEIGPAGIAFDESGALVAWARTIRGFEGVQLLPTLTPPIVIIESGGEIAPQPAAPPDSAILAGAPSDVSLVDLADARPPGTAERHGLVFYGRTMDERVAPEACDESVAPVYAFGESSTPWHVANLRGEFVDRFDVDHTGHLRAVTWCADTIFVTTGVFDFELMAIDPESLHVWQGSSTGPFPSDDPSGQLRWGAYVLDAETESWTDERQSFDTSFYQGTSDSGRFRYFSERGFFGNEGDPADPAVRVIVEDTESGELRPAFDDPTAIEAWRFIFGPGDEVAWMEGNELGTGAGLGRVDPNTGEIVDVQPLTHPYWGYPRSGSGDPGPDAIAFEADGRLRAWAYTNEPGQLDQSTWRIESLTFSLD